MPDETERARDVRTEQLLAYTEAAFKRHLNPTAKLETYRRDDRWTATVTWEPETGGPWASVGVIGKVGDERPDATVEVLWQRVSRIRSALLN